MQTNVKAGITTHTGELVSPDNDGVPSLYSIGVALGRIPRFCGHPNKWYPVLAHSLTCAQLASKDMKLHLLVHDADESVVSDTPTIWKTDEARKLERRLTLRMYDHWGITAPTTAQFIKIKAIDHEALVAEAFVLEHPDAESFAQEFAPPTERALELTKLHLEMAMSQAGDSPLPAFMRPEIAGPIFEQAFEAYR